MSVTAPILTSAAIGLRQSTPNTVLIYGPPAAGKSTQAGLRGAQLWKERKKKTRVIGVDPGGTPNAILPLLEEGIAEYWALDLWTDISPFTLLDLASKGYWPEDPATPNSPLRSCVREWKPCSKCGKDSGAKFHAMVPKCVSCGVLFGAGITLSTKREAINGLEEVDLLFVDGLSSAGDILTDHLRQINPEGGRFILDLTEDEQEAYGALKTEDAQKKFSAALPREKKIASLGKQHYQDAQTKIRQLVTNIKSVPVSDVLFTALELGMAAGENNPTPVYGPKLPGKALSKICISWFNHVIHLDAVPKKGPTGQVVRDASGVEQLDYFMYLSPHFALDNQTQRWEAKTSAPFGGQMPPMIPGRDCRKFFDLLEEARQKSKGALLG